MRQLSTRDRRRDHHRQHSDRTEHHREPGREADDGYGEDRHRRGEAHAQGIEHADVQEAVELGRSVGVGRDGAGRDDCSAGVAQAAQDEYLGHTDEP